jgi:hypothetical protein
MAKKAGVGPEPEPDEVAPPRPGRDFTPASLAIAGLPFIFHGSKRVLTREKLVQLQACIAKADAAYFGRKP